MLGEGGKGILKKQASKPRNLFRNILKRMQRIDWYQPRGQTGVSRNNRGLH